MRPIGGYIGLELSAAQGPHPAAWEVDLGRHALELVLRARRVQHLFVPRYTCDVLGPAILRTGVEVEYYELDEQLDPILPESMGTGGATLLYTNYFGLKRDTVVRLAREVPHLIVDHAQDFYAPVPVGADGFHVCRKFFGVPDGTYLHCAALEELELPPAPARGRYDHLLLAVDQGTEAAFAAYQAHEERLALAPLQAMSPLTRHFMAQVDHELVKAVRRRNRDHLHAALGARNDLPVDPVSAPVPLAYPFRCADPAVRDRLQRARIYVPRFWPGLLAPLAPSDGARLFAEEVLYLPVDQRYGLEHMDRILELLPG